MLLKGEKAERGENKKNRRWDGIGIPSRSNPSEKRDDRKRKGGIELGSDITLRRASRRNGEALKDFWQRGRKKMQFRRVSFIKRGGSVRKKKSGK